MTIRKLVKGFLIVLAALTPLSASAQAVTISNKDIDDRILVHTIIKHRIYPNPYPPSDSVLNAVKSFQTFREKQPFIPNHDLGNHIWLSFELENRSTKNEFEIIFDNYFIDEITLFQFERGKLVYQAPVMGDNYDFSLRPLKTRNFVFPVTLSHRYSDQFLVRINTHGRQLHIYPSVMESEIYFTWESSKRSKMALFYGVLLTLVFINYYLAWIFRDGMFGLLGVLLNSFLFEFIILGGWGAQYIWPNSPAVGHKAPIFFTYATLLSSFVFARKFLNENFKNKWFNRVTLGLIFISCFFAVASMGSDRVEFIGVWFMYKLLFSTFLILFFCGIIAFRKQHPTARYLTLAMLCMAVVLILNNYQSESSEYFMTRTSSLLLFGTGLLFLSLSVLDRLTILKVEKEKAQEQAIQNLQSLHDLKSRINEELEEKINEASMLLIKKQKEINLSYLKGESKERKRVAEELHDGLGGLLSTLKYTLQKVVQNNPSEGELNSTFSHAMDLINRACEEVRTVSHDMMPVILSEFGLQKAIENLIEKLNYTSSITFHTQFNLSETRFQPELELTLYRIILELLNNVIKHANATSTYILLSSDGGDLRIGIKDNGNGFDVAQKKNGMGFVNLKNRVKYLNGKYQINSQPGGTDVTIVIPIEGS